MPEDQPHHRFARAAGKATRSFLDTSKDDAERSRVERAERAERKAAGEAAAERAAEARRAATPATLTVARWWWAVATALFALVAVAFLLAGLNTTAGSAGGFDVAAPETTPTGQFVLAGLAGVLAVAAGTGTVQLLRSRRSAAGLLTGVAVIVGIPLIVRGHPALIALAAVLLAGAALLWVPAVRRYLR
ncbi:hypothetical protein AB0K08_03695 [Citricoccus sp. NPDC055426]|uniref:hypothetical protein n=1 Tax=Citricoccus sp. NPDC055426 TaxID=3155536 RepID=UPI00342DE066